eukprot:GHVU01055332.1.p3 GENE.GHVU01055332.1~~GHVU01055332.1.p3  ORF type:complete len:108 (+),score=12.81 GHVU01055332.1:119-442(+)
MIIFATLNTALRRQLSIDDIIAERYLYIYLSIYRAVYPPRTYLPVYPTLVGRSLACILIDARIIMRRRMPIGAITGRGEQSKLKETAAKPVEAADENSLLRRAASPS